MACNNNIVTVNQEPTTHLINVSINNVHTNTLTISNTYNNTLCVYGFATTSSLFIKSWNSINGLLDFLMYSKLLINSKNSINTSVSFKMIKYLHITNQTYINTYINSDLRLTMRKTFAMTSQNNIYIGKFTTLEQIDNYTLGGLDLYTLGTIDVFKGQGFELKSLVKTNYTPQNQLISTCELKMYIANTLMTHDSKTLSQMDNITLGNLDKTLIN